MVDYLPPSSSGHDHRRQLSEEVGTYVRELIFSGQVRPGEFLRLEPIAHALEVSTTPVREGLLSLTNEGFVQLIPRRGFVVASFSQQDVGDLFWVQSQIAGELAARAAQNITDEQLTTLERTIDLYTQAIIADDHDQIVLYGHRFHAIINKAAGSRRLALLLDSVVRHLPDRFYAGIANQVQASRDAHPLLLEALRKHDARKARSLMEEHLRDEGKHLIAYLAERGQWNDEQRSAS